MKLLDERADAERAHELRARCEFGSDSLDNNPESGYLRIGKTSCMVRPIRAIPSTCGSTLGGGRGRGTGLRGPLPSTGARPPT